MFNQSQLIKCLKFPVLTTILGAHLATTLMVPQASAATVSSVRSSVAFTCNDSEATIKAKNGSVVSKDGIKIYSGYQQVSSNNKNPILIRFDNGVKKWCRNDYETTLDDSTGYGLLWDQESNLFGVFSSTGSQNNGVDFRRFAVGRWLTSYGSGGGPKVAIIAKIDPNNGNVSYATFLIAKKPTDGTTNSLQVTGLSWNGSNLTVQADSWWTPLRVNKTAMSCPGSSPYKYTVVFPASLITPSSAVAIGCS